MNTHNFTVPSPLDTSPQTPPQRQQQSTTPRPRDQSHMQPQLLSEFVRRRPRSEIDSIQTSTLPVYAPTSTPTTRDHLPFSFGAEFEMIVRPRHGKIPEADTNNQLCRKFGLALLKEIAKALSAAGIPAAAFDPCDDEDIDYTIWNHYECRRDATCGFHVHISPVTQKYSDDQIRQLAKAIIFWGPATAQCAPPSRQDDVQSFCKSNVSASVTMEDSLLGRGEAFNFIDNTYRDDIVKFICPDKYRAWSLLPSKLRGTGSIEFRRAPGVTPTKQAKHWIAFTMSFIEMAVQFNSDKLARYKTSNPLLRDLTFQDFETRLLDCARQIGVYAQLDPRLRQPDNPRTLHITAMSEARLRHLQQLDKDYRYSVRAGQG
ncbi:MAG: hypothetical protein Q9202_003734 [Teloschistes flavicans]